MGRITVSVNEYFLQQHSLCLKLLPAYNLKKNTADLHRLRVAIKKIKAILLMLKELQDNTGFDKSFTPYKNIFKQVGPIREELLQKDRLKQDTDYRSMKNKPFTQLPALHRKLKATTPLYLKKAKATLPPVTAALSKLEPKTIYPYCQNLLLDLKTGWKHNGNNKELHEYRKQLKQLLYCANLLTPHQKARLLSAKQFDRLDKLQDEIGRWHDNILLLARIKKDHLKVSPQFMGHLKNETKELHKRALLTGNKL